LLDQLLLRWERRYGTTKPEWSDLALFRSLNMAFAASQIPAGIDLTQFHMGRSIALWVSAFEILTHSGTDVKLYDVYERIAGLPWKQKATRAKRYKPHKWKKKGPLGCWIYGAIHHARNDFLHGNPVDRNRLIVRKSKRNLFSYAAPLYRMALAGFLPIPTPPRGAPGSYSRVGFDFIMNQNYVEEALATVLITEKRYREMRREKMSRVKVTWRRGGQRTLPEHI
jgi:hypothetical protein